MKRFMFLVVCGVALAVTGVLLLHRATGRTSRAVTAARAVACSSSEYSADARNGGETSDEEAARSSMATQLHQHASLFDAALASTLTTLQPGRTNITEEEIAQIFSGLQDPTDIIDVIKPYVHAKDRQGREVARAFYEHMLQHYPEERLQACGHVWLGRLYARDALYDDALDEDPIDDEAFDRCIRHFRAVLDQPSKTYWYHIAIQELGIKYYVAGNATGRYNEYHRLAYDAFEDLYRAASESWMREYTLLSMIRCLHTGQERRAFYQRHMREISTQSLKNEFAEEAAKYRSGINNTPNTKRRREK